MAVYHVSLRFHLAGSLPTKVSVSGFTGLAGHLMSGHVSCGCVPRFT